MERQARFLVALARTRSVLAAARSVGMARESVYRLRKAPGGESFAAAWDHVLGRARTGRKFTTEERHRRAMGALLRSVVWQGQLRALVPKADDSALLGYLARLDQAIGADTPDAQKSQQFRPCRASTSGQK